MSPRNFEMPSGEVLAQFKQYRDAVSYVEKLVANDFPPREISIVGSDLRTIETLRGKLGYGRIALSGVITGSWMGLFFGLLLGSTGTTTEAGVLSNLGAGIIIGAGIGMLFTVIRFSLNKNKRNFISGSTVMAKKYEVIVPKDKIEQAKKAALAKPEASKS